jgi:phage-related protein (TIGR01555 family)
MKRPTKKALQKVTKRIKGELVRQESSAIQFKQQILDRRSARMSINVNDGWKNFMTGIGEQGRDKRTGNRAVWESALPEQVCEDIFASDALARRIVEILPNDALREWIEFKKEVYKDPLESELDRLQVKERLQLAWDWAREYGGAGIFINDGTPINDLWKPLDVDNLNRIKSLTVLHRYELWAWATDLQRNIEKPDFGKPKRYHVFPRNAFGQVAYQLHASRIVRFDGRVLPRLLNIRNNFWGDSVLTPLYSALGDYANSNSAIANVITDFRLLMIKISGLTEQVNSGQEAQVMKKIELMNQARSVIGAMIMDKEMDDADFFSASVAGVAELAEKVKEWLGALTDIPHSILFNESAGQKKSMGSSGDHEETNWYNTVHAYQMNYLKPRQDEIFKLIFAQQGGPFRGMEPENWEYDFKPLAQTDEGEDAKNFQARAQGYDLYIQNGTLTSAQVQVMEFPDLAVDPSLTQLQLDLQELPEDDDKNEKDPDASEGIDKDPNPGLNKFS